MKLFEVDSGLEDLRDEVQGLLLAAKAAGMQDISPSQLLFDLKRSGNNIGIDELMMLLKGLPGISASDPRSIKLTSTSPEEKLTASQARTRSRNDRAIFDETRDIESSILDSVDLGNYDVIVTGTLMTDAGAGIATAREYYSTWTALDVSRTRQVQMDSVINYFNNIGYSIERRLNTTTGDTFQWYVAW